MIPTVAGRHHLPASFAGATQAHCMAALPQGEQKHPQDPTLLPSWHHPPASKSADSAPAQAGIASAVSPESAQVSTRTPIIYPYRHDAQCKAAVALPMRSHAPHCQVANQMHQEQETAFHPASCKESGKCVSTHTAITCRASTPAALPIFKQRTRKISPVAMLPRLNDSISAREPGQTKTGTPVGVGGCLRESDRH